MTSVVLCGGQSTRMGTDKGLIPSADGNWAQSAVEKMASLGFPVVLSVNDRQHRAYSMLFPGLELIVDSPELPLAGPLLALLSIHERKPMEDLLIFACDMPLMQPVFFRRLIDQQLGQPAFDAFVFSNDGDLEPLCGLYTARGLATLTDQLHGGTLKRFSMKHALEQLNAFSIPIADDEKVFFSNVNFPPPGQTPSSL